MSNPKISLRQLPYQAVIQTPFGALGICMQDQRLKSLDFLPQEAVAKGGTRCGPWRGRHFRRLQAVENEGNEKSHFSFPCCKGPMEGLLQYPPQERGTLEPLDMATALVAESLLDYLNDPKSTIPFEPLLEGTKFQQRVWRRLLQIPPGTTVTYGQLAQELHSSPRAIGNACRANRCPLVVPCHRVLGKHGLGGFAGKTSGPKLQLKIWLLSHEGVLPQPSIA